MTILVGAGRGSSSARLSLEFNNYADKCEGIAGEKQPESYFLIDSKAFSQNIDLNSNNVKIERTIIMIGQDTRGKLENRNGDDGENSEDQNEEDSDFEMEDDDANTDENISFLEDDDEGILMTTSQDEVIGGVDSGGDDDDEGSGKGNRKSRSLSDSPNDDDENNVDYSDAEVSSATNDVDKDRSSSNTISELKGLWKNFISLSRSSQQKKNMEEIVGALRQQISDNKNASDTDIELYQNMPLPQILSFFPALSRANGTDSASFNRQLEFQFLDPLGGGNNRAVWMDQEFALLLKGRYLLSIMTDSDQKSDLTLSYIGSLHFCVLLF